MQKCPVHEAIFQYLYCADSQTVVYFDKKIKLKIKEASNVEKEMIEKFQDQRLKNSIRLRPTPLPDDLIESKQEYMIRVN